MSGTSADGIDAVVTRISGTGRGLHARILAHVHRPFTPALRRRILHTSLEGTVEEICELNFVLGEQFARAALAAIHKTALRPRQVTAIASHGQTIHHLPNARFPSTLQIGEPAIIAERIGITTVSDFRVADMAAGGQGAPLVPYADWAILTDEHHPRIIQNIGGIANLTFLPPGATIQDVLAFDTGPGNMLIDAGISALTNGRKSYDRAGEWAAKGQVSKKLLAELMEHPFLVRRPPKTTGREEFGTPLLHRVLSISRSLRLSRYDIVTTLTAFTIATIADAYKHFVFPRLTLKARSLLQIILGGGGAKNPILRRMLHEQIPQAELLTHEQLGIPNSAKEALAFAILAHETLHGKPSNVPSATGAKLPAILGTITFGYNSNDQRSISNET
jgi:anhydro-N-acetylmuramic acid kinase